MSLPISTPKLPKFIPPPPKIPTAEITTIPFRSTVQITVPIVPSRRPRAQPPTTPNCTLYIRNLFEKKNPKALAKHLEQLFKPYGKIIEMKTFNHTRLHGQAFILFETIEQSTMARNELDGKELFGKPLDVQYAREKSLVHVEDEQEVEHVKRVIVQNREKIKVAKTNKSGPVQKAQFQREEFLLPNSILFVQNLPPLTTSELLASLFQQFPGFQEIRLVPGKRDIAFVEYASEVQAAVAKTALHGFRIVPEQEIKVSYAKK